MAATDPNSGEELRMFDDLLVAARSSAQAAEDMVRSSESWRECFGDSTRFQRFEAARKRSSKTYHCRLNDGKPNGGSMRYADKPFIRERPRAISQELREFYLEQEMIAIEQQERRNKRWNGN